MFQYWGKSTRWYKGWNYFHKLTGKTAKDDVTSCEVRKIIFLELPWAWFFSSHVKSTFITPFLITVFLGVIALFVFYFKQMLATIIVMLGMVVIFIVLLGAYQILEKLWNKLELYRFTNWIDKVSVGPLPLKWLITMVGYILLHLVAVKWNLEGVAFFLVVFDIFIVLFILAFVLWLVKTLVFDRVEKPIIIRKAGKVLRISVSGSGKITKSLWQSLKDKYCHKVIWIDDEGVEELN